MQKLVQMVLTTVLLLVAFAFPVISRKWAEWQYRKQRALEMALVRLIQEPIKIASEHPADNTVQERADNIKSLLGSSGNTWVAPSDVHVYIYHPHSTAGHVAMSFAVWEQMVSEDFAKKKAEKLKRVSDQFKGPLHGQSINLNTL